MWNDEGRRRKNTTSFGRNSKIPALTTWMRTRSANEWTAKFGSWNENWYRDCRGHWQDRCYWASAVNAGLTLWSFNFIEITFKNSVAASQETLHSCCRAQLILMFRGIVAASFDSHNENHWMQSVDRIQEFLQCSKLPRQEIHPSCSTKYQ